MAQNALHFAYQRAETLAGRVLPGGFLVAGHRSDQPVTISIHFDTSGAQRCNFKRAAIRI